MKAGYNEILQIIVRGLKSIGATETVSLSIARSLLTAEACGVSSHGLRMLTAHTNKIKNGEYNITGVVSKEAETNCFARFNCNNQIGMVSAFECMQYAIDKAKEYGIFTVLANHCNTYSAAFLYSWQAAKQGLIGYTMSNSPAQMAPTGGCSKLLGTNPMSYAIPADKQPPIIFDMATSVVAKSKINHAKEKDELIPEGWALDENGNSTTDPVEAVKGLVLPMAGAKGYGLALMIDLLAGHLSGAACLDDVGRFYNPGKFCMNVGQVFVAINPEIVYGKGYYKEIDDYILKLKNSKPIGGNTIRLPGENKIHNYNKTMKKGLEIPDSILREFYELTDI